MSPTLSPQPAATTNFAELAYLTFADGLPGGWIDQLNLLTFQQDGLRTNGGAMLCGMLPGLRCRRARIEWDVLPISGAHLTYDDGTLAIIADFTNGHYRATYFGQSILASRCEKVSLNGESMKVVFEFDAGMCRVLLEDKVMLEAQDPHPAPFARLADLGIWDDCLVRSIRFLGADPVDAIAVPRKESEDFHLEVTVDFLDDVIRAPWNQAMFDRLFAAFRTWGVKRCHWIYYGTKQDGLLDYPDSVQEENLKATLAAVGEIFPTAVQAAHRHGIEIYALLKPFDLGHDVSFGEGTELARTKGLVSRVGGPVGRVAHFAAQHREWTIARKPGVHGPGNGKDIVRIDLVKEDAGPAEFAVENVALYVSDDNATYRPYAGPIVREDLIEEYPLWEHTASGGSRTGDVRLSRVLRLSELKIAQKYLAVTIEGEPTSFGNTLINLVHVFTSEGEERCLTYGNAVRKPKGKLGRNVQLLPTKPDFREIGLEYDCAAGTPTACFPGYEAVRDRFLLGPDVLGIARGKDRALTSAMSPSFPEVREWWLSWLRQALEDGADGIELRVRNHHSPFAWAEFGFEPPVRDEFLERHGVDIWETDDFDRTALRRLRGEAYTEFCREARRLATSFGKSMGLHISPTEAMEPEEGGAMEIHWDWRTWLREGLADSITLKEIWPGSRLADEILPLAREHGVAAIFSPYANNIWQNEGGEKVVDFWIRCAREGQFDGYQFYECAAIVKADEDSQLLVEPEIIKDVFLTHFRPR
jgi:hypothetical protein